METLKTFKITHILTLDSVPLPQHIVDSSFLTTKYVQSKCRAAEGYGSCIPIYIYIYLSPFSCRHAARGYTAASGVLRGVHSKRSGSTAQCTGTLVSGDLSVCSGTLL